MKNTYVLESADIKAIAAAAEAEAQKNNWAVTIAIVDGGETNYISATLALYLDIINVFQSLLALLGIMGGERD